MNLSKFLNLLNFLCSLYNRQLLILNAWGDENGSVVKNLSANAGDVSSISASGDLLEKEMETHSSILAWESHGQRSLAGYSPKSHKESDVPEGCSDHMAGRSLITCLSYGDPVTERR